MTPVQLWWAVGRLRADPPVDLGRDEARELARDELANPVYDRDRPFVERAFEWILDRIDELIARAGGVLSSGLGVAILVAVVLAVAVFVIVRTGPLARRRARGADPVFTAGRRGAAEHRAAADRAAASGDWDLAVLERYRGVVAGLEERSVIEPRTGRTADEAAREAGSVLGGAAEALTAGAAVFDAVLYGGHRATSADAESLREVDDRVRRSRPGAGAAVGAVLVPPR